MSTIAATTSHPEVDEARVAADAIEYARRLAVLERAATVDRIVADERRATAQDNFDKVGLPRGLAPLDAL